MNVLRENEKKYRAVFEQAAVVTHPEYFISIIEDI